MNKPYFYAVSFAILCLFTIQLAGTLVESIYILDLLNTNLDEKALGLLFFFTPLLLIPFRRQVPGWMVWTSIVLLIVTRGLVPYLDTAWRLVAAGIGTGTTLLLLPLLLTAAPKKGIPARSWTWTAAGFGLGVGFSILLRTVNFSLDFSLTPEGGWIGWGLGILLAYLLTQLAWQDLPQAGKKPGGVTLPTLGLLLVLTLAYFVFSAPGVLARWTGGNYAFIITAASLMTLGWAVVTTWKPCWGESISAQVLLAWNLLFSICLVGTILAHRVGFPLTPDSPAVVIGQPGWIQQIPLVFTLLLYPVILLDFQIFARAIRVTAPSPSDFVPGMVLGSLALILLVFMNIFTNVWGYVEPVSPFFRNKFWLPFALISLGLTWLAFQQATKTVPEPGVKQKDSSRGWVILLAVVFLATAVAAVQTARFKPTSSRSDGTSLVLMTYNIQQANDPGGSKAYQRQLALIQQVDPDLVALQECDSTRISLNNNDFVRYYAGKLGYYSYYGPSTISGTYGTAILSKFPLENPRSVFSYSDQDEIGTAEVEIEVGDKRFTIYNVHPDGSDQAMQVFAETLLTRSAGKGNVIALGDYNLRENEAAYQKIAEVYDNAWLRAYPTGINQDGLDMSGNQRIDHIFISPHLGVQDAVYLLSPESATDHPAHWATVFWDR